MLAILGHNWHWLAVLGYVLYLSWPWVASAGCLILWRYAAFLERELRQALERCNGLVAARDAQRTNARLTEAYAWGQEWQARYELLQHRCQVEHVERPLPTRALGAEQRAQLEEEMPF